MQEQERDSRNTDEAIMACFQAGETDAFQIIFDRYSSHVINFAYRFLNSQEEAEDIAQEVFLKIYRAKERYDANRPFRPWLFSIASRLISNQRRSRKRHPQESLDWSSEDSDGRLQSPLLVDHSNPLPDEILQKQQLIDTVKKALEKLPGEQRKAVLLARYEEMSYEEIAITMEVSVSAVKSLLFRARGSLKASLGSLSGKEG